MYINFTRRCKPLCDCGFWFTLSALTPLLQSPERKAGHVMAKYFT